MIFNDLREFVDRVAETGDLQVIRGADTESEIGVLSEIESEHPDNRMFLFDDIKGYPPGYRVVTNLFSTPRRAALGLGLPLEFRGAELVKAFRDRIRAGIKLIPPVEVKKGPVQENIHTGDEVNLYEFPSPKWRQHDGGRYIGTGCVVIMKDPDEGWVNVGTYRVQVHDRNVATLMTGFGHDGYIIRKKYFDRGMPCPVAVSCGQEPLLFCASTWEHVRWGVSEYDFAGGLRGSPVQVVRGVYTGLPVPATAEIVLEGEMVPPEVDSRVEGPFGEWPGYYGSGESAQPALRVKAILHRDNPIIQGNPPSRLPGVFTLGRHYQKAAALWDELDRHLPGVKGVRMIEDAGIHSIAVVSLKQEYEGHAKQAALLTAGASATVRNLRFVIIVDDDIDPFDTSQVLWALGTRCEPETSIEVIKGCWGSITNPLRSPEMKRTGSIAQSVGLILACKPFTWIKDFPRSIDSSPELRNQTREKWQHVLRGR